MQVVGIITQPLAVRFDIRLQSTAEACVQPTLIPPPCLGGRVALAAKCRAKSAGGVVLKAGGSSCSAVRGANSTTCHQGWLSGLKTPLIIPVIMLQ